MNVDWLRKLCLSFPHATEQVQWGYDLVFKVGGKMFAITPLEPARVWLTFKATDEAFAELTERPSIIPAPYLARAMWVALENSEALPQSELSGLLRTSYDLVFAKLPRKIRDSLSLGKSAKSKNSSPKRSRTKSASKKLASKKKRASP